MAIFKSLNPKDKIYIFKAFDNDKDSNPAKAVFKRFPLPDETFIPEIKGSMFDDIDFTKVRQNSNEMDKLIKQIMRYFSLNLAKVDYSKFLEECVDHFESFFFEDKEIKTVNDFIKLPVHLWVTIASELYDFAVKEEVFTAGELQA
ncbi:MAG: hypothetical protein FWC36_06395 [Spirochaetes bacterium]|nr:hypothetical protein [Spirochaetota bacterium]